MAVFLFLRAAPMRSTAGQARLVAVWDLNATPRTRHIFGVFYLSASRFNSIITTISHLFTGFTMIQLTMTSPRNILLLSFALLALVSSAAGLSVANSKVKATTLPKLDPATSKYAPPPNISSLQFYSPVSTLIRAGPVPFVTRLTQPDKYEQAVWKYMVDAKETSLQTAQGNMDAFFAAPDVWVEQKLSEQQGKREVYDYGKDVEPARIALASIWGGFVVILASRVFWQLIHGNRNLF